MVRIGWCLWCWLLCGCAVCFRLRVYGLLFVVLGGLVCGLFSFRLLFVNFCCWVWFAGLLRLFSYLCCG